MVGSRGIIYKTCLWVCLVNELRWHFRVSFRWWNVVLLTQKGKSAFYSRCLYVALPVTENSLLHTTVSVLSLTVKLASTLFLSHTQLMGLFRCLSSAVSVMDNTKTAAGRKQTSSIPGAAFHIILDCTSSLAHICKSSAFPLCCVSCSFQFFM